MSHKEGDRHSEHTQVCQLRVRMSVSPRTFTLLFSKHEGASQNIKQLNPGHRTFLSRHAASVFRPWLGMHDGTGFP